MKTTGLSERRWMKRMLLITLASGFAVFAFGQEPNAEGVFHAPQIPPGAYKVIAVEIGVTGKLVKGAPYTAEVVTEFVQTLAEGNRILRRQATNVYRDSQGRTRKEHFPAASLSRTLPGEAPSGIKVTHCSRG